MPRKTIRIADQRALSRALSSLVNEFGTQKAAADAVGVLPGDFSRLLRGEKESIEVENFRRVLAVFGGALRKYGSSAQPFDTEPREFAFQPEDTEVYEAQAGGRVSRDLDLETAREQLWAQLAAKAEKDWHACLDFREAFVSEQTEWIWGNWVRWMEDQLSGFSEDSKRVVEELWRNSTTRSELERFLTDVGRPIDDLPPDSDLRAWLALLRVAQPLSGNDPTWGVEPGVPELGQSDRLLGYIQSALKAQMILLNPAEDLERVMDGVVPAGYADRRAWELLHPDDRGAEDERP